MKTKSLPNSLPFKSQVTEQTTVKRVYSIVLPLTVVNLAIGIDFEKEFCLGCGAGLFVVYVCVRNPDLLHDISIKRQVSLVIVFSKLEPRVVPRLPHEERTLKLLQLRQQ